MKIKILTERDAYSIARRAANDEFVSQTKILRDEIARLRKEMLKAFLVPDVLKSGEPVPDDFELSNIEFSPRILNVLSNAAITTAGQLRRHSDDQMVKYRGMGRVTLAILKNTVALYGIKLEGKQT